ncbi:uncharacterized protein V1518DRAFT_378577 [Limtongia smithiae]|uniref:uncharacterized protein n=1 Tax=Limtongia smithiae TaxID=1125753 RepID=UPI0034CD4CF4
MDAQSPLIAASIASSSYASLSDLGEPHTPPNASPETNANGGGSAEKLSILDFLENLALTAPAVVGVDARATAAAQRRGRQDIERAKRRVLRTVARWDAKLSEARLVNQREKLAFAFGLGNVFLSGLMIGAHPEWFHVWYTVQVVVLMPVRVYSYRKLRYQYFLADLCYFVNGMLLVYLWILPSSGFLYLSVFCLTYGTLAWAVITWRNSLVLHSIDKTTSALIHVLPPVVLHVINFELEPEYKAQRFLGAASLKSASLTRGLACASVWYFIWQSLYHFFITIRRKDKIAAGRLTSFEWLRRSYKDTHLGIFVNSLPEPFPVLAFTGIQFGYQILTMLPCPIWYRYKYLSAAFVFGIFMTAAYNGATYYIDVFGRRFQKELHQLQSDVSTWHNSSSPPSPVATPRMAASDADVHEIALDEEGKKAV